MRNNVLSFWADYRVAELERMWLAGRTGSEIAAELGITRCAVLGKIHRLELAERPIANNRRYALRTPEEIAITKRLRDERRNERRRTQRASIVMVNVEALRCIEVVPLHKSLIDLGPNDCRFPYGDKAPYTFCGHPQMEGRSYCGPHFGLSVRRGWGS